MWLLIVPMNNEIVLHDKIFLNKIYYGINQRTNERRNLLKLFSLIHYLKNKFYNVAFPMKD